MIDYQELEHIAELQHRCRNKEERERIRLAAEDAQRQLPGLLAQNSEQINRMARALRTCGSPHVEARIRQQITDTRVMQDLQTYELGQRIELWAVVQRAIEALRRAAPVEDRARAAELKREIGKLQLNAVELRISQIQIALKFKEGDRCELTNRLLVELGQPVAWRESQSAGYESLWTSSKQRALEAALVTAKQERASLIARRGELLHAIELLEDQLLPD